MHGYVVSDGHIVADVRRTSFVGDVYTATILYIGAVADGDRGYIATNHGVEPYGTLVAHRDIAYNRGVLAKIAISPPFGSETAI
jgi:hypothetical protein